MPPIGLRMNNFFQVTGNNRNRFNALAAPGTLPQIIPSTDFETGFFSIFTAGNFGSDIAFWVDDDISVAGANGNGGLGDAYLRFVNIGRFLKLPKDALTRPCGPVRTRPAVHPGAQHQPEPLRYLFAGQRRSDQFDGVVLTEC